MRIRIAAALLTLTTALLWADVASADGPLTLEARTASSLTVSWSWNGQPASAYDLAWRARAGDSTEAWRSVRKTAAQRRHTIEGLDTGALYTIRIHPLDANDRPLAAMQGTFATNSAAAEDQLLDPRLMRGLAERLALELESSRELCTAGTLTEISWQISGGKPPYALQIESSPVAADAENVRIDCGALSEAEAADEEAALAAKRISAVVTDARGVRREAALDVARARALPAPTGLGYGANVGYAYTTWDRVEGAGSQSPERPEYPGNPHSTTIRDQYLVRYRATGEAEWQHATWATSSGPNVWETAGSGVHEMQVAAIRHSLESETPSALRWSETLRYAYGAAPANPTITTTATTVTVSWDAQPYAGAGAITLAGPNGSRTRRFTEPIEPGQHSVTFSDVPPETSYDVIIDKSTPNSLTRGWIRLAARTDAPPAGWTANPTGPQNVAISTSGNEITVTWASPYPGAPNRYDVVITEESTSALVDVTWVTDTTRRWSTRGIFRPIRRGGTYRVRVTHVDLVTASVYKTVTVPASAASGAEDAESTDPPVPPIGSFFPFWPATVDGDYAIADDEPDEPGKTSSAVATDSHEATPAETTTLRYNRLRRRRRSGGCGQLRLPLRLRQRGEYRRCLRKPARRHGDAAVG